MTIVAVDWEVKHQSQPNNHNACQKYIGAFCNTFDLHLEISYKKADFGSSFEWPFKTYFTVVAFHAISKCASTQDFGSYLEWAKASNYTPVLAYQEGLRSKY